MGLSVDLISRQIEVNCARLLALINIGGSAVCNGFWGEKWRSEVGWSFEQS